MAGGPRYILCFSMHLHLEWLERCDKHDPDGFNDLIQKFMKAFSSQSQGKIHETEEAVHKDVIIFCLQYYNPTGLPGIHGESVLEVKV